MTFTGKLFDPINPNPNSLEIKDIAHSLSLICRCNGHSKIFYSVGMHSIFCCHEAIKRGLSNEIILGCLLHDASEAYLSDVTRPIKKHLDYYLDVEDNLQHTIWNHFIGRNLTIEEMKLIFEIDDQMLSLEFKNLMPTTINDEYKKLIGKYDFNFTDFNKIEEEFIELYNKYSNK
jgi:hypothetical protein